MCKSEEKNIVDILYAKIFTDFISNKWYLINLYFLGAE